MIQGPDGVPFVLDRTTKSVYRIDPADARRRRGSSRQGTNAAGGDRGGPEAPRPGRDPRPARRRRARTSSGAGDRPTTRAPGRRRRSGSRTTAAGATTSRGIGTFLRDASAGPLQPLRRRSLGAADPRLLPGQRRRGFPAAPIDRLAVARDVSKVDDAVHRQRHLRHRRRPHRPVRRRPEPRAGETDELPDSARSASSPDYSLLASASDKRTGSHLRLGQAEQPGRRDRQGQGHVHRAVPPRRRQPGLGGRPRDVRRPRPARTRRRRWSGPTTTASISAILEAVPDVAAAPALRPSSSGSPGPASGAPVASPRASAAAVIPLRDANPVRRTPIITIATDRRLRRGLRLHPGRRGQPGRSRASTSCSRRGASSRPSSSRPGRRATT